MQFFHLEELVGDIIVVVNPYSLKQSSTRIAQSKRKEDQNIVRYVHFIKV